MITVTAQSKNNATITGISESADYTINDLADYEIQELDFPFDNQGIIVAEVSKNNATITGETK